jgi:tRNA-dihydrouridine synthase
MRNPGLVAEIVREVSGASSKPVTVKIRKGWDEKSVNAVEIALIAEEAGAAAVTVHGRTREQYYSDTADWDIIREVKSRLTIPVIGNGDIFTAEAAIDRIRQTATGLWRRGALRAIHGCSGTSFPCWRQARYRLRRVRKKESVPLSGTWTCWWIKKEKKSVSVK